MKNFIIAVGHTASGNIGCGVIDRIDESSCNREIGTLVVGYLKEKGYSVKLLRIDKSNSYTFEDCYIRANQANEIANTSEVEIYVEIHINAGGGSGSEVCITGKSEVANQYAAKISNSLSSTLNLPNRGVKTRSLIVLNNTVMPAILVECLFADSNDANVYNPEVIAGAIVDALIGVDNSNDGEWKLGWNRNDVGWWYCNDAKNKYQNGWKEIDGEWYIFDSNGYALQCAWHYNEKTKYWYYFDLNCKMVRGSKEKSLWIWIDNGCYAFNEYGQMYCDCFTPDGYRVDKNGEWLEN